MSEIRKAVFPAAGLGTRFLPATKAIPKEMLPIVDTPQIQVGVQEALDAGIEKIIFVIGRGKDSVVDHFDVSYELEAQLSKRGNEELLSVVRELSDKVRVISIRQKNPLGLGHAILCAKDVVGDEPFAVILSDDIIRGERPVIGQMAEIHKSHGGAIVSVMEVPREEISKYGAAVPSDGVPPAPRLTHLKGVVEKPPVGEAPSNLAIIGRYILPPEIFGCLEKVIPDSNGEIQLTDGIRLLMDQIPVYAYEFEGKRYDAGDKLGFLQATVEYGLDRSDIGPAFRDYLRSLDL